MRQLILFTIFIALVNSFKISNSVYTSIIGIYPESKLPPGSTISIRGDNCNLTWTKGVSLKKTALNTWSTSLLCPSNVKISVKLLINDTKWMMGANQIFTATQSNPINIYPSFNPSINAIETTSAISSKYLANPRKLSIYYPPSYKDNNLKKYELLLMHDGQNLFDPKQAAFGVAWMCQDTANTLIVEGAIREMIIVGIWNTADRNNEYTYSYDPSYKFGGKGDLYLNFIQEQLMLKLKNQILKDRLRQDKSVTIGGSSLGGLISCYATYTRPTIFGRSICMSSSFWWNNEDFKGSVLRSKSYSSFTSIYVDSGDSGPSSDGKNQTVSVFQTLKSIGYQDEVNLFYYLDKGGQHSEKYWGDRFWIPLKNIFNAS